MKYIIIGLGNYGAGVAKALGIDLEEALKANR